MNDDIDRGHDDARQGASEDGDIRDAVTWQDTTTYSLSLPQVYARFVEAGLDRSLRTLQRYCEQGHLRAAKYPTETGSVWYVDAQSVETKIEEIRQVQETLQRPAPPSGDTAQQTPNAMSGPDAERRSVSSQEFKSDTNDTRTATSDDEPRQPNDDAVRRVSDEAVTQSNPTERQSATRGDDKYVTVPVGMLDALTAQLAAKDEQIKRRDEQMERLVETHDKDRRLLGAALSIIHREDFPFELGEGEVPAPKPEPEPEPEPAEEIRPQSHESRGNPQPPFDRPSV